MVFIQAGSNWYYSKMTRDPNADNAWTTHAVVLTKAGATLSIDNFGVQPAPQRAAPGQQSSGPGGMEEAQKELISIALLSK